MQNHFFLAIDYPEQIDSDITGSRYYSLLQIRQRIKEWTK